MLCFYMQTTSPRLKKTQAGITTDCSGGYNENKLQQVKFQNNFELKIH